MSKMIEDDEAIWDRLILKILFAYRVCSTVASQSPLYLMYGRDIFLHINTLLHSKPKYVGTQLHRQICEQMHLLTDKEHKP